MAIDLNLKVDRQNDGSIHVSWNDAVEGAAPKWHAIIGFSGIGLFFFALIFSGPLTPIVGDSHAGTVFFGMCVVAGIGGFLWLLLSSNTSYPVSNKVIITAAAFIHNNTPYPTTNITRIEYGDKKTLTGTSDPKVTNSLIRIWIDDNSAHVISENNWENQVSHQIRDTLAKALDEVRKGQADQNHETTHGKQSDFGMPDL